LKQERGWMDSHSQAHGGVARLALRRPHLLGGAAVFEAIHAVPHGLCCHAGTVRCSLPGSLKAQP